MSRYGLVNFVFGLLGVGVLVPWNAFISAKPYFSARLCENGVDVEDDFESTFARVYNLTSVASLTVVLLSQWLREEIFGKTNRLQAEGVQIDSTVVEARKSSVPFWQVILPLAVFFLVFVSQTVLVLVPSVGPHTFWRLTISQLGACGLVTSIATAGIVNVASTPPWNSVQYFLAGQSFGGVAVACANWVAALWNDPTDFYDAYCTREGNHTLALDSTSTLSQAYQEHRFLNATTGNCVLYNSPDFGEMAYFGLGALVMIACIAGYLYIVLWQRNSNGDYETVHSERGDLSLQDQGSVTGNDCAVQEFPPPNGSQIENEQQLNNVQEHAQPDGEDEASANHGPASVSYTMSAVWSFVWAPCVCIFMTFVVTLAVFPGWTSSLASVHRCQTKWRLSNDLFVPSTFLVFNVCDLTGRILSSKIDWNALGRVTNVPRQLVGGSFLRLTLIPLLFVCPSLQPGTRHWPVISSDLFSLLVQCLLGVTNGLLVTTAFVVAPTMLPSTTDTSVQARSSTLLTLAVSLGLLSGSLLSFPMIQMGRV